MLLHDRVERLIRSFRFTANLLQALQQGLTAHRTAWIGAKPSILEQPVAHLEGLALELAAEEQRRAELLTEIAAELPLPTPRPGGELKIDVSLIAARLPPMLAAQLRQAAAATTKLAQAVRAETVFGNRLLQFSRSVHEGLVRQLVGATHKVSGSTTGYDRNARKVQGDLVGTSAPTGSLVDGRL